MTIVLLCLPVLLTACGGQPTGHLVLIQPEGQTLPDSQRAKYTDETISIIFEPNWGMTAGEPLDAIEFELTNKHDSAIEIVWAKSAFVDPEGVSRRVLHKGIMENSFGMITKAKSVDSEQPPTVIPPDATHKDFVAFETESRGPVAAQMGFVDLISMNHGDKVTLSLAFKVNDEIKRYNFEFQYQQEQDKSE